MKKVLQFILISGAMILFFGIVTDFTVAVSAPNADVDLEITMLGDTNPVIAGNLLTYQISVQNLGSNSATGVVVNDTPPDGTSFASASDGCKYNRGHNQVACDLGTINSGEAVPLTITVLVDPVARGSLNNIANVSTKDTDTNPDNNTASITTSIDAQVDLSVTKDDGLESVVAGDTSTHQYAITVINSGPSQATNVQLNDTWPAAFTRLSLNYSQGSCSPEVGENFTCQLGSLLPGGQATIIATYQVPSSTPANSYINQVEMIAAELTAALSDADITDVTVTTDLQIEKSDGLESVLAGDGLTHQYAITVTNTGPSLASSVVVTDAWPAELAMGVLTTSQGSCNAATLDPFTCMLGALPVGSQAAVTATYSVPADTPAGTYTNQVEARTPEAAAPSLASDITLVSAGASLGIAKSDGLDIATAGDGLTHQYAITVTNSGLSLASSVVVTDTWPAGFLRGAVLASQGACDTSTNPADFTCSLGSIPVGAGAAITATFTVPSDAPVGTHTNQVVVSSPEDTLTHTAADETTVIASASLGIAKSDGVNSVVAGDGLAHQYAITVTNNGPSLASSVLVTDTWPVVLLRGTVSTSQGACDTDTDPSDFVCLLGSLMPGSHAVVTANYSVAANTPAGVYMNQVAVSSPAARLPANAMDETAVKANIGLWVVKSDGAADVIAGDGTEHLYTLTVGNAGPSLANSVAITDTWPAGLVRVQAGSSEANCDTTSNPDDFTCFVSSMPVGSEVTITATYTVPPEALTGKYTNLVQVGSLEGGGGNLDVDDTTVRAVAGLGVAVGSGQGGMVAGDGILYHYAITVTNSGPSLARNVIVTDTWPAEFERRAVTSSLGSCDAGSSSGNFACFLGNLPGGAQSTISITYVLPPGVLPDTYTNRVEVGSIAEDPDLVDNTDSLDTIVEAKSNIGVGLSHYPETIVAGKFLTYMLEISNGGPSDATSVMVTDILPIGFTFNHALSSPECTENSGVVLCQLGTLDPGSNKQIVIVVQVDINVKGTIINQVTVSASSFDPYPADNKAETPTTILEPDLESPTLSWILPVPDENIYDVKCDIVRLEVDATDNVEVQSVNFYRWDILVGTDGAYVDIGSDGSAPYQWDFSTCDLNPKYNQVFATAIDASGNTSIRKRILLYRTNTIFMPLVNR